MAIRTCCYCGKVFLPDRRVGDRQKACSWACQKLRKRENNRTFSRNNPGYWRGRYDYLRQWRLRHPDYQRQWRQSKKAKTGTEIQAERIGKAIEFMERLRLFLCEIQAEILLKSSLRAPLRLLSP